MKPAFHPNAAAGISLSWGTGYLAADFAIEHGDRRAAVIDCGAVGLAAAKQLQRRGFEVTIYTMSVPPDTTSNMALAGFTPTSGFVEVDRRTPPWDTQFRRAAEIAYRQLQLLVGSHYGVSWIDTYSTTDELRAPGAGDAGSGLLPANLQTGQGFGIHMMPRADGIALGGTAERGVWTLQPKEEARKQIMEGHIELFAAMRVPDSGAVLARSEAPSEVPSLESFFELES